MGCRRKRPGSSSGDPRFDCDPSAELSGSSWRGHAWTPQSAGLASSPRDLRRPIEDDRERLFGRRDCRRQWTETAVRQPTPRSRPTPPAPARQKASPACRAGATASFEPAPRQGARRGEIEELTSRPGSTAERALLPPILEALASSPERPRRTPRIVPTRRRGRPRRARPEKTAADLRRRASRAARPACLVHQERASGCRSCRARSAARRRVSSRPATRRSAAGVGQPATIPSSAPVTRFLRKRCGEPPRSAMKTTPSPSRSHTGNDSLVRSAVSRVSPPRTRSSTSRSGDPRPGRFRSNSTRPPSGESRTLW